MTVKDILTAPELINLKAFFIVHGIGPDQDVNDLTIRNCADLCAVFLSAKQMATMTAPEKAEAGARIVSDRIVKMTRG